MNLTEYIQQVSREDFGKEFRHQAHWNRRLKTTGGRFFPKDGHLDFNPRYYEADKDLFRKIVRHELCHYHLYFEQKGYRHKDRDFKELLQAVDGVRYAPQLASPAQTPYLYRCQQCGQVYPRKRRVNTANYRCGKCRGFLTVVDERNQSLG
ncbi:SprT family protein [Streptococcus sp. zg-86]|uniref:Protein SprT-like n=1 Tax=Streptococcus zhangguiae TaxID=2664091 RepID=A0A6I4RH10_9STRE|nr:MULTISPECIES: SprT family protein [unclassified Streptococcus]MTB64792.1 SprT family protein [Streptococcus sp. zg-86]MTB91449.1 SprT family protein [Streptococcus sp. zg-36]MWV56704.1 SprT family protein [Streptococcus sp. zg-70]QTH48721.1 SprT family protein [Streptococcus sp. zg-86]